MNCDPYREAISALVDGEDPGVAPELYQRHVERCAACREWSRSASVLAGRMRLRPAEAIPDLTSAIVGGATGRRGPRWHLSAWRAALVLVALAQLIPALSDLFVADRGVATHLSHEVGSWDVALSIGFLVAAWRPARAWGMLPLVAAVVACLLATSGLDLLGGQAAASLESVHALPVLGLGLLAALAHSRQRPEPGPTALPGPEPAEPFEDRPQGLTGRRQPPRSATARRSAA